MERIKDASELGRLGSWKARNFLTHEVDVRDLRFLAGVWGLFLGVMGYVLIFKP